MIARTTIELPALKQQESNPTVPSQIDDQPKQSFSSLLASSKAAAEANSSTGHLKSSGRQKFDSGEERSDASPNPKEVNSQAGTLESLPVLLPQLIVAPETPKLGTQISLSLSSPLLTNASQNSLPSSPEIADTAASEAVSTNEQSDSTIQKSGVSVSARGTQLPVPALSPTTDDLVVPRKEPSMIRSSDVGNIVPKSPTTAKALDGESIATPAKTATSDQANQAAPIDASAQINWGIPVTSMVESFGSGSLASTSVTPSKPGLTKNGVVSALDLSAVAVSKGDGSSPNNKGGKTSEDPATTVGDVQTVTATTDNDRVQAGNSTQNVITATTQTDFAAHLVHTTINVQNVVSETHSGSTPANSDRNLPISSEKAAPSVAVVAQPLPTINTARLIQSMGQSEMRLGMRSEEFGNISIHTSTTRDLLSAQISIDNGDLAKVLAAHLPEIRTRLESNQAGEVRIDMNSQGGQATMSNGASSQSQGESRGDRRPTGQASTGISVSRAVDNRGIMGGAALPSNNVTSSRLDIRI
jgi:hypothetical protein